MGLLVALIVLALVGLLSVFGASPDPVQRHMRNCPVCARNPAHCESMKHLMYMQQLIR